jgi:hypothetical protein
VPSRFLKRFQLFLAVTGLSAYAVINLASLIDAPIHSDGYSYFVYLPAVLLNSDPSLQTVADDCCGGTFPAFTSIIRWPETGRWVNPHPVGVAVLMAPFFVIAHGLTRWSNLPPDGFSLYYQHAAGLAGLFAVVVGLALLRRLLSRYLSDGVVLATLVTITFGTNLFHYATFDSTFSHAFSFLLIAALLETTDRWWRQAGWANTVQLGAIAALIFLTRHPNAMLLAIVPLWNPSGLWARRGRVAGAVGVAAIGILPQLALYHHATGHWFVSVYSQLGQFDFRRPRILSVLFGVRKGLFFWSPALLFAAVGFFIDHPLARRLRVAAGVTFAITAYLIASWSDWQFGGSFGHRGFTDCLAVAAIFLAVFFEWLGRRPRIRAPIAAVVAMLVVLSTLQMVQYWIGVLPIADTTWAQYRSAFLRFR